MPNYRVEREWVPLKQYLPTTTYAEVLDILQHDIAYSRNIPGVAQVIGNEAGMNAMIRYIVQSWLRHRKEIEDMEATTKYREDLIENQRMVRELSKESEK